MSIRSVLLGSALALGAVFAIPADAATLTISDGLVTGATGVVVAGTSYDVVFADGSCSSVFGGCDSTAIFDFTTFEAAAAAASALRASFDSGFRFPTTSGVVGCSASEAQCFLSIPYLATDQIYYLAFAMLRPFDPPVTGSISGMTYQTRNDPDVTFARFSPSPVPLPSALPLLSAGLAALAGIRLLRRRSGAALA